MERSLASTVTFIGPSERMLPRQSDHEADQIKRMMLLPAMDPWDMKVIPLEMYLLR